MTQKVVPCFFSVHYDDASYQVSYEITNACNLKCKHCCNTSTLDDFGGMSLERVKFLVDDLSDINANSIYMSGGEPTRYPGFMEIVDYIHAKGIDLALATNGTEIEHVMPALRTFSSTREGVFISLDGLGPVHDRLRGVEGAFDKTVASIRRLLAEGIPVRISSVVWKDNVDQLEDIVKFVGSLGVYMLHFSMLFNTGRASDNDIAIPPEQYAAVCRRIQELSEQYSTVGFSITMKRNQILAEGCDFCHGAEKIIHVNSRGYVFPCSWIAKTALGERYGFKWEPGRLKEGLQKLSQFQDVVNRRIDKYGYSGCPAVAFEHTGDLFGEDPLNDLLNG